MFAFSDKTIVIFDLEYTMGKEIAEIGAIKVTSDLEILDQYSSLVRPICLDEEEWTDTHFTLTGITRKDLSQARPWKEVWREWAEFHEFNHTRLMAWHAYNDQEVLNRSYSLIHLGRPHKPFVVDIAAMAYFVFNYVGIKCSWGKKAVCNRLHIPLNKHHRALSDAVQEFSILRKLQEFEKEFLGVDSNVGFGDPSGSEGNDIS